MSFIITVVSVSVWITVTSGITLGPSTSGAPNTFNNPSPHIVNTMGNVWQAATSCEDIFNTDASNPTGDYRLIKSGKLVTVHCNMDQKLCGQDGPWTRIGYLNMSEAVYDCPPSWEEYTKDTGGIRTCGRKTTGASCDSEIIPSLSIAYSQICGRVIGYQYATPDAVYPATYRKDIEKYYVDGVSITRGTPRKHIWTLMAGLNQNGAAVSYSCQCPCHRGCPSGSSCTPYVTVESFIGNDWYCESGNHVAYSYKVESNMSDQLWDGKDCQPDEYACCEDKLGQAKKPWFHKVLPGETMDHLEICICGDEDKTNENILITAYELYVK